MIKRSSVDFKASDVCAVIGSPAFAFFESTLELRSASIVEPGAKVASVRPLLPAALPVSCAKPQSVSPNAPIATLAPMATSKLRPMYFMRYLPRKILRAGQAQVYCGSRSVDEEAGASESAFGGGCTRSRRC